MLVTKMSVKNRPCFLIAQKMENDIWKIANILSNNIDFIGKYAKILAYGRTSIAIRYLL